MGYNLDSVFFSCLRLIVADLEGDESAYDGFPLVSGKGSRRSGGAGLRQGLSSRSLRNHDLRDWSPHLASRIALAGHSPLERGERASLPRLRVSRGSRCPASLWTVTSEGSRCPARLRYKTSEGSRCPARFRTASSEGSRCPLRFRHGVSAGSDGPARSRGALAATRKADAPAATAVTPP